MRLFRKHARLRSLDERECYLRLHGIRSGKVAVLPTEQIAAARPLPEPLPEPPPAGPDGPTDAKPALHLVIAYPRNAGRLTGEQMRRELLRRMRARTGAAA